VGLAAAELERHGISTVAVQFKREAAVDAHPPRALFVPFRYGFPADPANEPGRLLAIVEAALSMLESREDGPPLFVDCTNESQGER
jgi:hypothetical protein